MLDALVVGTHDPELLAELARGRLRSKLPALREALTGRFRSDHHGLLVSQILAHIDYLDETIAFLSDRIEQVIAPFSRERELLETIPGVARLGAEVLIAELGVDMNVFPTDAHLASWAGQCPGNHESAGKHRSGRPRHGSRWLQATLTESAKRPRGARAPTSAPSTHAYAAAAAPAKQPARCATQSSSPPTTSSSKRSPTENWAPTTSTNAPPNSAPKGSSDSSKNLDTPSRSNH